MSKLQKQIAALRMVYASRTVKPSRFVANPSTKILRNWVQAG